MKKIILLFSLLCLVACQNKVEKVEKKQEVYYEIFVASFNDSNGDGVGDLNGITNKLDYLDELGVTGLWLMPIHPSDTYHKYDVKDYKAIDESYGTLADFENLVSAAKKRNIDIIIDLVVNHSSDDHEWFQDAKDRKNCNKCDYYNFSEVAKTGYEKLDDQLYYEARFWKKMPDLNLKSENVRNEIKDIAYFWLDKGVKGFRLDAVGHFDDENLNNSIEFTNWFSNIVKEKNPDAYLVGEVWKGETTVLSYYESKIDSLFDFAGSELAGRIVSNANRENGLKIAKETLNYNEKIKKISPNSKNAVFISNHDQPRSAGYLSDDDSKKLIASIYLLTPGVPFIYYGEEIGMKGSGKDENKRLALTWGENKDTKSPKDSNYTSTHKQTIKEALNDNESVLNHYKKVTRLRHLYVTNELPKVVEVHEAVFGLQYGEYKILVNTSEKEVIFDAIGKVIDAIGDVKNESGKTILPKFAVAVIK